MCTPWRPLYWEPMTWLCVPIRVESVDQAVAQVSLAAERGADMVELRLDGSPLTTEQAVELVRRCSLPCIVTCRTRAEGGEADLDDATRAALFEAVGTEQPAYIDVELAAYQQAPELRLAAEQTVDHPGQAGTTTTGLILSTHDFNARPRDLLQRVEAMAGDPTCRVMKLAWRARSLRDNLEAFELLTAQHKPTIALCMGTFGLPSRVLAKKFGALLTFAGLEEGEVTAPGQPAVETVKRRYRWDAIDAATAVHGVIGWPVEHSLSPVIHNAGFDETDTNAVYLPLPVPPEYEHFKATVGSWLAFRPLHFRGASVTLPHKEHLLRYARETGGTIDPITETIGAANTLTVRDDGSVHVSNTDYGAALDAVATALGGGREGIAGRRVAVLGAGGVARAVAAGFAGYGAEVVLYNRTYEKARSLAEELTQRLGDATSRAAKVAAAPMEELPDSLCDVYINCTPVGMHPNTDASPIETWPRGRGETTVVFDTIYNPPTTRLLKEAEEAGHRAVSGLEMFIRQGAEQFEQWTQQPAPIERFRTAIREATEG